MKLSLEQVKKVAKLANLPLSEQEDLLYVEQLSKILDYIDQLDQADTSEVEPTFNVTGFSNVLSVDELKPSLSQKEAINNATKKKDGFFVTKGVFEEE